MVIINSWFFFQEHQMGNRGREKQEESKNGMILIHIMPASFKGLCNVESIRGYRHLDRFKIKKQKLNCS